MTVDRTNYELVPNSRFPEKLVLRVLQKAIWSAGLNVLFYSYALYKLIRINKPISAVNRLFSVLSKQEQ